jgi:hypothetical protein
MKFKERGRLRFGRRKRKNFNRYGIASPLLIHYRNTMTPRRELPEELFRGFALPEKLIIQIPEKNILASFTSEGYLLSPSFGGEKELRLGQRRCDS